MKLKTWIALLAVVVAAGSWVGYLYNQDVTVWFSRQWAGIALHKGGYRSWSARFCDGETLIDGKMQPVVIEGNQYRQGYYRWPQFRHVDMRGLYLQETATMP